MEIATCSKGALAPHSTLDLLLGIEREMKMSPVELPDVQHFIGDGTYCRVMDVPADTFVMGHMHRGATVTSVLQGCINMLSNHGMEIGIYTAGDVFVTPPETKRLWYSALGGQIMTIHATRGLEVNPLDETSMKALQDLVLLTEGEA